MNLSKWKPQKKIKHLKSENQKLKYINDRLTYENNQVKQQSNKNENYSRRKNIVRRGITEKDNEINVICKEEARKFICEKLNLSKETVSTMDFVRCHRMGGLDGKRRGRHEQKRPLIVRFNNSKDKSVVGKKRFELAGN